MNRSLFSALVLSIFAGSPLAHAAPPGAMAEVKQSRKQSQLQARMGEFVKEYLKIQEALAKDTDAGVKEAAQKLVSLSESIKEKEPKAQKAVSQVHDGAEKIAQGKDIKELREGFKELSGPVVDWALKNKPKNLDVFSCSMAPGKWVQRKGEDPLNPYYGKEMLNCGEKLSS